MGVEDREWMRRKDYPPRPAQVRKRQQYYHKSETVSPFLSFFMGLIVGTLFLVGLLAVLKGWI